MTFQRTEDFYQTEDTYYIVLELMEGGELFNRVKAGQGLDEAVAKQTLLPDADGSGLPPQEWHHPQRSETRE